MSRAHSRTRRKHFSRRAHNVTERGGTADEHVPGQKVLEGWREGATEGLNEVGQKLRNAVGLDGPTCANCGGLTQRTGACYTCVVCGDSTGCG
jgi:hypothetical protein